MQASMSLRMPSGPRQACESVRLVLIVDNAHNHTLIQVPQGGRPFSRVERVRLGHARR